MGFLLKWGNWGLAKVIEALFNTSHLSDVGCTYRLLRRTALERVQHRFTVGSEHFGPELMLLCITSGLRMVEVPVNYLPRVGVSSVTGSTGKAVRLGVRMTFHVLGFRLRTLGRKERVDWKTGDGSAAAAGADPTSTDGRDGHATAGDVDVAGGDELAGDEGGAGVDEDLQEAGSSA